MTSTLRQAVFNAHQNRCSKCWGHTIHCTIHLDSDLLLALSRKLSSWALSVALLLTLACSPSHSQGEATTVRQVPGEEYSLVILDNSPTFSQASAINASGQLIGVREVVDKSGNIFSQESFFFDGQKIAKLPLLDGFTNIEASALSDTGLVVGYASRPMGHANGSLTGFVWDSKTEKLTRLMPFANDTASQAHDISADGRRITGYTNGSEPTRLRPCLWTWNPATEKWDIEVLSVLQDYNPYTVASRVVISPDGARIAACITVKEYSNNQFDSSLFMWEWSGAKWQRRLVSDEQMVLRDMNNEGEIAAIYTGKTRRDPCFIDAAGKLTLIGTFAGDVSGEAHGINAEGTVVGFSDDPTGPEGGPQAFMWKAGKSRALKLPEGTVYSSAFGINDLGQIAGLLDVVLGAEAGKETPVDASDDVEQAKVKTLAFRWTPKKPPEK